MNIQEARQAGFEKFLAEQKKWIEEENLEPLTATEIGSMILAWNAALDSVVVVIGTQSGCCQLIAENERLVAELGEMTKFRDNAANHMRRIRAEPTSFEKERDHFAEHCNKAALDVAQWPAWKQEALGTSTEGKDHE